MQQAYQPRTSDEFEMNSRRKLIANNNSLGTESENSAINLEQLPPQSSQTLNLTATDKPSYENNHDVSNQDSSNTNMQKPISNSSLKKGSTKIKALDRNVNENQSFDLNTKKQLPSYTGVFDASILMYEDNLNGSENIVGENDLEDIKIPLTAKNNSKPGVNSKLSMFQLPNNIDATTRGGMSTTYNQQIAEDSLSTLSDKKKKVIVRIVTIFSVIFFLICFAMIAFTLRMSEKIDAQIRKGYSGSNFNAFASTKINNIVLNFTNSSIQPSSSNLKTTDTKPSFKLKRAISIGSAQENPLTVDSLSQKLILNPNLKNRKNFIDLRHFYNANRNFNLKNQIPVVKKSIKFK